MRWEVLISIFHNTRHTQCALGSGDAARGVAAGREDRRPARMDAEECLGAIRKGLLEEVTWAEP